MRGNTHSLVLWSVPLLLSHARLTLVTLGLLKKTPIAAGWGSLRERSYRELERGAFLVASRCSAKIGVITTRVKKH